MSDFLSRSSLVWLLLALCSGMLLHLDHLPLWVLAAAAVSMSWRLLIHAGRISAPPKWSKVLFVAASFAGVYLTYGRDFSLESTVTLFAIGAILKPLEVTTLRDTYVLIFLCYFLCAVQFLFDQDPQTAFMVIVAMLLTMSAQVSINLQTRVGAESATESPSSIAPQKFQPLVVSGKLFVQSIPLAIVLFIFVPRVAPLWSLNVKTHAGTTGLSDTMSPGDIAQLGASDALAFIATFEGNVPANEKLYWRALTLDDFDGKTWRRMPVDTDVKWVSESAVVQRNFIRSLQGQTSDPVTYQVLLEPHDKKWLMGLDWGYPLTSNTGITQDFRLVSRHPILSKTMYWVESDIQSTFQYQELTWRERQALTQLPAAQNPQTRKLARDLQSVVQSDQAYINAVSQFYRQQPYKYTLKPSRLTSDDTIDEFLFSSQQGFCAHYAGSFTYLMRLAGIPARIVTGYQGGEFNEDGNYLAVYQYNAHAWVEVWLQGQGWTRIDPTTFVAPERVLDGVEDALQEEFTGRSVFSSRNWAWLNQARLKLEAFNYYWHRWVLSYSQEKQESLIEQIFGKTSVNQYALFLLGIVLSIILALAGLLLWQNRAQPLPPLQRLYHQWLKGLQKLGVECPISAPPSESFAQAASQFPHRKAEVEALARLFSAYLYGSKADHFSKQDARLLAVRVKRMLRQLR